MLVLEQILVGVVMPAALAAALLAIAWRPWRGSITEQVGRWGAPLAFGAAYLGVHFGIAGVPELAPTNDMQWLVHIAAAAAAVGLVEAYARDKAWLHWLLRAGVSLAAFWLLLGFMVEQHWGAATAALWLGCLILATLAIIATLEMLARAYPGVSTPLVMVLLGTAGALVLVLGGTAKVAQLLGGLTAAAGAALVFTTWSSRSVARGGATVFALLFAALFSYGYLSIAEIPALSELFDSYLSLAALLVVSAVFLLWAARLDLFDRIVGWQRVLLFAVIVGVPLGGAVYLAANPLEASAEENKLEGVDYDSLYQ